MNKCLSYYNHLNVINGYTKWHVESGGSNAAVFRMQLQKLFNKEKPYTNGVLVDLGSGPGTSIAQLHPLGFTEQYAVDGAPNMLMSAKMFLLHNNIPVKTLQADFLQKPILQIDSQYADLVLLCSTIMYFQSIEYFFSEAARILKKEGIFAVSFMVRADGSPQNQQFDDDGIITHVHSHAHIVLVSEGCGFVLLEAFDLEDAEEAPGNITYKNINYLFRKI